MTIGILKGCIVAAKGNCCPSLRRTVVADMGDRIAALEGFLAYLCKRTAYVNGIEICAIQEGFVTDTCKICAQFHTE